ncbi:MAG: FAD-binding and (Fe-S)-binding domain-containing protein [Phycisphaerae bacterium]
MFDTGVCHAPPADRAELAAALAQRISGETRFDPLTRTIYATDASLYEITPAGVVLPKDAADVVEIVRSCRSFGMSIIPRGAGTGLTGGAVGAGVAIDLSRWMRAISELDRKHATVRVEAGVVLDQLNRTVRPLGLHFAPDVATSSRATLGGMIANNSCGAYSVRYGRTVDHVVAVDMVLSSGERVTFSRDRHNRSPSDRVAAIEAGLTAIRDDYADEIERRFPKVLRSNGGYGLDRLGSPGAPIDPIGVICGSEGTLGVVVAATLRLTPLPKHRALLVLHFDDLAAALCATPAILEHRPAAVELLDRLIIDAGRTHPTLGRRNEFLRGDPEALLIVELFDEDRARLGSSLQRIQSDQAATGGAYATVRVHEAARRAAVWDLRRAGLGLLMSKPGDAQPYAFVEDSAVDPARLAEYIRRFQNLLAEEGVAAGYYAHASVGCLHVRPILNLKRNDDVRRMERIAERVSDLALEFGGAMTGEHGDGLIRSCWLEKMYGRTLVEAFAKVKSLFDPIGIMNPGKIVDAPPMTKHLRQGADFQSRPVHTALDFSVHGGMAGLVGMCSGVGQCRQDGVATMCPSYMATGDEQHTTRARANALRVALSNRGLLDGLDDEHLTDVLDLCLLCKACKTECPTGVDMARLKVETLHHRNLRHGVPPGARFIADFPDVARRASRFPRLANAIAGSKWMRSLAERRYGLDRRIAPPRFAPQTFRAWFHTHTKARARHAASSKAAPGQKVVYFVDTWTNFFTPQVGIATVRVLEFLGFEVACPATMCCGRPAISKGLLSQAGQLARTNIDTLSTDAMKHALIVGTEPSCIMTLVDEYPQLVRGRAATRIAERTRLIDSLLADALGEGTILATEPRARAAPRVSSLPPHTTDLVFHGHCHQRRMVGTHDTLAVLRSLWGDRATELDAGCCGMAGSFGHEEAHYDVAKAIGEHRLFPLLREHDRAQVAVSGFSCREQIAHHTGRLARHWIEYVADRLLPS